MGALHDQLRGVLEGLAVEMSAGAKDASDQASVVETQTVEPLFKLLGYPVAEAQRQSYYRNGIDRLAALERLCGRFQASSSGEFVQFVNQSITAELGALRSRSLADAEEAVAYAFDRGSRITGADVCRRCLSCCRFGGHSP